MDKIEFNSEVRKELDRAIKCSMEVLKAAELSGRLDAQLSKIDVRAAALVLLQDHIENTIKPWNPSDQAALDKSREKMGSIIKLL